MGFNCSDSSFFFPARTIESTGDFARAKKEDMKKLLLVAAAMVCFGAQASENVDGKYERRGVKGKPDADLSIKGLGGTYVAYGPACARGVIPVEVLDVGDGKVTVKIKNSAKVHFCKDETMTLPINRVAGLGAFSKD
jgi:hypothetical protein